MSQKTDRPATLAGVIDRISEWNLASIQQRDMISAVNRLCAMAGVSPASTVTDVPTLRRMLAGIRPARHDISPKTLSNLKSQFRAALELAGVIEPMGRGRARGDPRWHTLMQAIKHDKRQACGLATFANWCAGGGVAPEAVDDSLVMDCLRWLETRALCPKPHNVVRRVPHIWNEAAKAVSDWPQITLTPLSFRQPQQHLSWGELHEGFCEDAEHYLASREKPDLFDERANAPRRPLAPDTCRLQRDHLRLAAAILFRNGTPVEDITCLADLIQPESFKTILRHYHEKANGKANAFAVGVAKTLQQVARYHVGLGRDDLDRLKALAAKLPSVPFDLTDKNKKLLRQLESEHMQARLVNLPLDLLVEVRDGLEQDMFRFVDAQVAIAVDIALIAPLRPENLLHLNWARHFLEPDGSRGLLRLYIPKLETKTKQRDLVFEFPDDVANRLRWYRQHVLPRLRADPSGDLFVTNGGALKDQKTLASQIIGRIERHVGLHMTPHQFRHVAASFYLRAHPDDFRTVTDLLGHSSAKTTLIYAGVSSQRASRVYTSFVLEQREALKLKGQRRKRRQKKGSKS